MGRRVLRVTAFGFLVGTLLGLCYAAHSHFVGDDGKPILWTWSFADYLPFWWGWGLLAGVADYLVHRFPISRERRRNALAHLAAAAVASPLHSAFCYASLKAMMHLAAHIPHPWELKMSLGHMVFMFYPRGMVYYLLMVAIVHALNYYQQYEDRALAASQLEAQLAHAKLHLLKMQLHPHFLFNTLNSISALMHEDVEQADRMIERLGDFLRLTLAHSMAREVTLREELDFVNCYLSIEQIRLQERLTSVIRADPEVLGAPVPNLILQPIVENAIRHGIAPREAAGRLEIQAHRRGPALVLTVRDDGPGLADGNGVKGGGMGLQITRTRLERMYGKQHHFALANAPEGGLIVTLEIPFAASNIPQVPS